MSELNMGSGPKPLHIGIAAGALLIASGAAYFAIGSDSDAKAPAVAHAPAAAAESTAALPQAAPDTAAATAAPAAPAAPAPATESAAIAESAPPQKNPASAPSSAPAAARSTPSPATSTVAEATPTPAIETAAAAAAAPAESESAAVEKAPAAEGDNATPVTTASAEASADNHPRPPVATPPPPASDVLDAWWTEGRTSPFGIAYVGQMENAESMAIVFTMPVDPKTLTQTVRVVDDQGQPVTLDWQRGGNSRMAIASTPGKGRYTMFVAENTRGVQSPLLGTSLHGPVYIQ